MLGNMNIRIKNNRLLHLGPPTLHELPPMQKFMVVSKTNFISYEYESHLK